MFVLIVGSVALVLRLIHLWQIHSAPFFTVLIGDAVAYDAWASRIAAGEWIGNEVFYQAPLYPYFLGIIYKAAGHNLLVVRVVQALIGSASCVWLGLTAWRLFSQRAGFIAGLALAAYAPAIFFDGLIQKSVLDAFFICLSLWLLSGLVLDAGDHRLRHWIMLGLVMGGLSLTRENALTLVVVVALWALLATPATAINDRLKRCATFVFGVALMLAPVVLRNAAVGGGFYLTTAQFGPNLFIGNNARADGTYASLRFGRGSPEYERQDATELAEHAAGHRLTPAEVSGYWTDRALDYITAQPGAWLKLMARKFVLLWNRTEMVDTESQQTYAEWSWPLRLTGWLMHFGVLVPLALFGAVATWSDRRRLSVFYALTVTYAASVLLFYVFARYRFPLTPLLLLFAAAGLGTARVFFERAAGRARTMALALIMLTAVFTNWPLLSAALMKAITENNLAAALQGQNRLDAALAHYQRAIALEPGYAPAYNNMGTALRAAGRLDEAVAAYRQALSIVEDYPDAHYNLANALLEQHRPEQAADHFRTALQALPRSAASRNNLGIALMASGKVNEAIAQFEAALTVEPGSAKSHKNLGEALAAKGQFPDAITHLRRVVELEPGSDAAHYDLGSVLLEAGRFADATTAFRQAIAINPRSAEAFNNLGIALGSQGQVHDAVIQFQQALALKPDFENAQRNLALALATARKAPGR
jgi:tetratricopeptide (TPR) repeat protein